MVSSVAAASAFAPFGSVNALAQSGGDYKALVCVFQTGGNDCNNLWVPLDGRYDDYQRERKELALTRGSLLPVMNSQNEPFGFHPACGPLQALYQNKKLAVVQNVGTLVKPTIREEYRAGLAAAPLNLFSHSDQIQQWQTSVTASVGTSGWSGRVADKVRSLNSPSNFPPSVSITGTPIQLLGLETRPTTIGKELVVDANDGSALGSLRHAAMQQMLEFDSGLALFQVANLIAYDAVQVAVQVQDALKNTLPLSTPFPATTIGSQLAQVARIIQVRAALGMKRQIFFVSQGGYDNHAGQLLPHNRLLGEFSAAVAAFYQATEELGVANNVVTFSESEFGRTLKPNNGLGTDHAWGGHLMVMGGPVKGGATYGQFPVLASNGPDDMGISGRWIPTTSIDQYAATLASWFGVSDLDLGEVFPNLANFSTKKLNFLG
jgi:uncharacterized protein (DUF1501 family)